LIKNTEVYRREIQMTKENTNDERNTKQIQPTMLTMRSGNTTFVIGLHFNGKSKENMGDKVKKLIKQDIKNGNF
jgi:uncharacterized protein YaaQ